MIRKPHHPKMKFEKPALESQDEVCVTVCFIQIVGVWFTACSLFWYDACV